MAGGINGLDKLMKKYGQLAEAAAGDTLKKAIGSSTKIVQAEAKLLCPVDTGELRGSIRTQVIEQDGGTLGVVYTNKSYAPYVEFGTGPKGQANHAGISPAVTPAYSQTPWPIKTKDGRFYQCTGQPAQPFMYPALKNNEERVTRNVSNYLAREVRKVCGK